MNIPPNSICRIMCVVVFYFIYLFIGGGGGGGVNKQTNTIKLHYRHSEESQKDMKVNSN